MDTVYFGSLKVLHFACKLKSSENRIGSIAVMDGNIDYEESKYDVENYNWYSRSFHNTEHSNKDWKENRHS